MRNSERKEMESFERGVSGSGGFSVSGYGVKTVEDDACIAYKSTSIRHGGIETYKLLTRALPLLLGLRFIALFTLLSLMEPTTDTQPLSAILLSNHDFFNGVEAVPRLNLKEDELIPARRYDLTRLRLGLESTTFRLLHRIKLQSASPLRFPIARQWHVKDVGYSASTYDVIVIE